MSEPKRPPRRKQRLFTVAMWSIPVLFFVLLEGGLRVFGYGDDYPLFVPLDDQPEYLYQSREVAKRYFSHIQSVPTSLVDFFKAQKDSTTFRIFVQGGSSAAGFPFYQGGSFSRELQQRLQQTFPDRRIEVVNTAMAAVNSYTLLDLVDEIIAQQPDLVLVYAGHNEYYGALGVGSSETLGGFPFVVRGYLWLERFRTTQLLRQALAKAVGLFSGREKGERPSGTLMERMVGEQSIPYRSTLYEMGLRQFRENLSLLLEKYEDAGIPVFIGTLASNERDIAPFVNVHGEGVDVSAWDEAYERGLRAAKAGDGAAALDAFDRAIALDSLAADAYYARGRVLDGLGRYDAARAAFIAAKDRDALRFRAPEAMNALIRRLAAQHGATVVDVQDHLAHASPDGIIGKRLMLEHLHPTLEGYFDLADAFYDALHRHGAIGTWDHPISEEQARAERLVTPVDSLLGLFRIRKLMAVWPFQPPGVVDHDLLNTIRARDPIEQIALDLYEKKVSWREANDRLRRYYESRGDYHHALQTALVHIQSYPILPLPYVAAGNVLIKQGRYDEALYYFEAANDRQETSQAQQMIGSILLQRGLRRKAIEHLERAVALDPQNEPALYNLSGAYALMGNYDEARQTVDRLLKLDPQHRDGLRLKASLPD